MPSTSVAAKSLMTALHVSMSTRRDDLPFGVGRRQTRLDLEQQGRLVGRRAVRARAQVSQDERRSWPRRRPTTRRSMAIRWRRCNSRTSSIRSGTGPSTTTSGAIVWIGSGSGRVDAQLREPGDELLRRRDVHDPIQANPGVRGGAHRAVLARCVDRRASPLNGRQVLGRPSSQSELRVTTPVTRRHAVAAPGQYLAVRTHRTEPKGSSPASRASVTNSIVVRCPRHPDSCHGTPGGSSGRRRPSRPRRR